MNPCNNYNKIPVIYFLCCNFFLKLCLITRVNINVHLRNSCYLDYIIYHFHTHSETMQIYNTGVVLPNMSFCSWRKYNWGFQMLPFTRKIHATCYSSIHYNVWFSFALYCILLHCIVRYYFCSIFYCVVVLYSSNL